MEKVGYLTAEMLELNPKWSRKYSMCPTIWMFSKPYNWKRHDKGHKR